MEKWTCEKTIEGKCGKDKSDVLLNRYSKNNNQICQMSK